MEKFLAVWSQHKQGISRLAQRAYYRSCQKGSFDADDFTQEAAIAIIRITEKYGSNLPPAFVYKVVRNRFGTILHAQYLEVRYITQAAMELAESSEPLSLTSYFLLSQQLSPLAQQVMWILIDPPDSFWEKIYLQETSKISRKIIARYLGVAPQRVSEALKELREALSFEKAL